MIIIYITLYYNTNVVNPIEPQHCAGELLPPFPIFPHLSPFCSQVMSSFGETHWSFGEIITDCWAPRTPAGVIWWARAGSSMHFDTRLHRWRFRSKLNTKAWTWVIQWDVSMFKQFLTTPKKQRINPVVYDLTFTLISWPQLGVTYPHF